MMAHVPFSSMPVDRAVRAASEKRRLRFRDLTGSFVQQTGSELYSSALEPNALLPCLHLLVIALYAARALQASRCVAED